MTRKRKRFATDNQEEGGASRVKRVRSITHESEFAASALPFADLDEQQEEIWKTIDIPNWSGDRIDSEARETLNFKGAMSAEVIRDVSERDYTIEVS